MPTAIAFAVVNPRWHSIHSLGSLIDTAEERGTVVILDREADI